MGSKKHIKNRNNSQKGGQTHTLILIAKFEKKYRELEGVIFDNKSLIDQIDNNPARSLSGISNYTVFISVCNVNDRAMVKKGSGSTLYEAWRNAGQNMTKYLAQKKNYEPAWIKVDIVSNIEPIRYDTLCGTLRNARDYFYRKGIAFDNELKTAVIESELNGRLIYDYKNKCIALDKLNKYFQEAGMMEIERIPQELFIFDCKGYIYDDQIHELYDQGYDYGRRKQGLIDKEMVNDILNKSSDYLIAQLKPDGSFVYGYYPAYDRTIPGYNIIRHIGSLWAMILCYKIKQSEKLKDKIIMGIDYLLKYIVYYDNVTAFVVEEKSNEIKLGANSTAVIMLIEFMETFKIDYYDDIVQLLGNGIIKLQNPDTGEFYHVLNAHDFSGKAKDRIVYYDGEATFALMKLYGHFKDEKWMVTAKAAFNYFIENKYYKHADHWIGYSIDEYLKNDFDEDILQLCLDTIEKNLNKIYLRDTSYHTYLELLMTAFETITNMQKRKPELGVIKTFNTEELAKVIFHRARHQLNGFIYPEVCMYFKHPHKVLNTFCVRHDAFRVRIDDIQHFIDGYYYFYRYYDELYNYL